MDYPPVPTESKGQIDVAGRVLASDTEFIGEFENARRLTAKWRACHVLPLRAFADDLRHRLEELRIEAFVAMRLKRLFRVRGKLRQFPTMRLTSMQDIGALRAVVPSMADLRRLAESYTTRPPACCAGAPQVDDYLVQPKQNGYRSLHMTFRYRGAPPSAYDGIRIELQLRTHAQHEWASAVEVTGLRTGHQLKYDEGDPAWAEFFELAAELIGRSEGCPSPSRAELSQESLRAELVTAASSIGALESLSNPPFPISQVMLDVDTAGAAGKETVLLKLNLEIPDLRTTFYSEDEQQRAMEDYLQAEDEQTYDDASQTSVVLVSVNSVKMLRAAYPTFFLDTTSFARIVNELLARK